MESGKLRAMISEILRAKGNKGAAPEPVPGKRPRGRPKGSKNKPKADVTTSEDVSAILAEMMGEAEAPRPVERMAPSPKAETPDDGMLRQIANLSRTDRALLRAAYTTALYLRQTWPWPKSGQRRDLEGLWNIVGGLVFDLTPTQIERHMKQTLAIGLDLSSIPADEEFENSVVEIETVLSEAGFVKTKTDGKTSLFSHHSERWLAATRETADGTRVKVVLNPKKEA
jgi:hypothetical protein